MRPKKTILLCCVDTDVLSEMRLVMEVWGFLSVFCATPEDALLMAGEGADCALLIPAKGDYDDGLVVHLQRAKPDMPVVLLFQQRAQIQTITSWVAYEGGGRGELRQLLKTAVARKRGPKKVHGSALVAKAWTYNTDLDVRVSA